MSKSNTTRRVAMVTLRSVPNEVVHNAEKAGTWAERAAKLGAKLVLFPEAALTGNVPNACDHAIRRDDPSLQGLAIVGDELGIALSIGFWELDGDKRYVAQAFIQHGQIDVYRKVFCCESGGNDGDTFPVVDWDGAKVGTLICWDLHFPMVTREMVKRGARLILHPSAYHNKLAEPFDNENHNVLLPRCRAKENGVFFLHCNASGQNAPESAFMGNVIAVGPDGDVLARIDQAPLCENMVTVDLDLARADAVLTREWVDREFQRTGLRDSLTPGK